MSPKGYLLKEADLHPLSLGAALLGTGGGGNPYIGMLRTRELLRSGHEIRIIDLDTLPDDAFVGEVGGYRSAGGRHREIRGRPRMLLCHAGRRRGRPASRCRPSFRRKSAVRTALSRSSPPPMPACRCLTAMAWGRAFPEVQMTTFFIYGAPTAPGAIADEERQRGRLPQGHRHVLAGAVCPRRRRRHGGHRRPCVGHR